MEFLKRTWTEVSLDALEYNYRQLRGLVPSGTRFLGVVKADAYGHGAVQVSRSLSELGAEFLAVSNVEEAMQLRNAGISPPILILGYTPPGFAALEAERGIRQEVNSLEYARELSAAMAGTGKRLKVHFKLDTGRRRSCPVWKWRGRLPISAAPIRWMRNVRILPRCNTGVLSVCWMSWRGWG